MNNQRNAQASISTGGPLSLLGIAFVVLKLTHVIDWSWWWVLLPFYGPLVLILVGALMIGIFLVLVSIFGKE